MPLDASSGDRRHDGRSRAFVLATRALALAAVLLGSRVAAAGELSGDMSVDGFASTWRGDLGAGGRLRLGYRFAHIVSVDAGGWEHYATVNKRLNTGLTLGVSAYLPLTTVRPMLRLYFVHQHEESLVSVADHPLGTLAGLGAGIRHRAGLGSDVGVEVPILATPWGDYHVTAATSFTWIPDTALGPALYYGVNLGFGLNYSL